VEGQQLEYAAVSGERNVIQTHNLLARLAGLPRSILHGACLLATYCTALTRAGAGNDYRRVESIRGRFVGPVLPGQILTLSAYDTPIPGALAFEVTNAEDQTVFTGGEFVFKDDVDLKTGPIQ
jgi:acyl dehydratase